MKDRVPRYPGRIKLVPSDAGDDLFILTRDDEPQQLGTPLNKASLLSDATAQLMDLPQEDPTVDDALASIGGRFTMIRGGTVTPGLDTTAKKGDIYILENGAKPLVYVCDAVGVQPVGLDAEWERGGITTGGVSSTANYRVRSQVTDIPAGTVLSVASGFRFALYRFNDAGEYVSVVSLRTSAYTVSSDMRFRILIARVTEDTSETADVAEFSSALSATSNGAHWSLMAAAREVRKTAILTSSQYWTVPRDLRGDVTIRVFGGGAGGGIAESQTPVYGGGGGHMALWTGTLTAKRYEVQIGAGGEPGQDGGTTSFGSLVSAAGGSGSNGGSGGGNGGNGSYGGGGGGYGPGGNGGTYGGGGGGGSSTTPGSYTPGYAGGSGRAGQYSGGAGASGESPVYRFGGGGGGYSANGAAATSSAPGKGGAGANTVGFGLEFEGTGAAGTRAGGGGGYGGPGGKGYLNGVNSHGGGGGGYGAKGGAAGAYSGGGGGGFGGPGGDGSNYSAGGGGGYGLSGAGGSAASRGKGGIAAGGAGGYAGGDGVVIITYTGVEVY